MKRIERYITKRYVKQFHSDGRPEVLKAGWIRKMMNRLHLNPREVVEYDCGSGRILSELSRHYPAINFKGYDTSPQAINIARKQMGNRLEFFETDFISWAPGVTDLLLVINVLEHVPDYYELLESLRTKASNFIFYVPLDLSCRSLLRPKLLKEQRESSGNIHYFSKEMVMWMMEDAGYEIVDWYYAKPIGDVDKAKGLNTKIRKTVRNISFFLSKEKAVRWWGGYSLLIAAK